MLTRLRKHTVSFKHALDGIWHTIKTQPNFRFHLIAIIAVTLMGIYFSITTVEWLILFFTFNMVIVAEMLNTSVESMVDLITLERREDAKDAKDVSAGMVLMSALFSVCIGLYIFLPKIITSLK
jgi:diacylglycerol kinase